MATPVKNIEKDFLLKVLYDEKLPVIYLYDRIEYTLYLERPAMEEMIFKPDQPIGRLKVKDHIELIFDYRSKAIVFNVEIKHVSSDEIVCTIPDFLYKNLDRTFSRVSAPAEMQIQFTFQEDRYNLSFPRISEYDIGEIGDLMKNIDPKNLTGLIDQMASWIKTCASSYRLVIFKDLKPTTVEERVIAETGKALFLPSTQGNFPPCDPYPRKRIITEDMFKRYLESTGVGTAYIDNACARFVNAKADNGIYSDAWIPILFQEYVIGYIHIWNSEEEKDLFDYPVIDTLFQFAKVLAYSLKVNGYFEKGKIKKDSIDGKVIDISASGLLFAYPQSDLSSALLPESNLSVKITTEGRSVTIKSIIVRRFKDNAVGYFGCRFMDLSRDDFSFLFEFIYGKPFTDFDATFFAGQV